MDVTLILTALATGIAAGTTGGLTDVTTTAIKEAYESLKTRIRVKFAGKPIAEEILEEHEKDPKSWEMPLKKYLTEVKANQDGEIAKLVKLILEMRQSQESTGGTSIAYASGQSSIAIGRDLIGHANTGGSEK